MRVKVGFLTAMVLAGTPAASWADDVTDQINEALAAYAKKDVPTAIAGLEAAANLLRQKRADIYGSLLPAPPSGWTADDVKTISAGLAMVGGGAGATREYHRGSDNVTVSILSDSPLLQVVSTLASSGFAAAAGARTQIVNGRRTLYMKDEGSYTTIIADRTLVRVEGRGLPEETLKQFLTAIDFAAVETAVK